MASLTGSYKYLGRSTVMKSVSGSLSYYVLLYGKTSADEDTGIHTVTIQARLASINTNATFYGYPTTHNGKINGDSAFSGENKPNGAWELGSFTAGGVSYKTGTVLGEGSVNVDCTNGTSKNITVSSYWKMGNSSASYTPSAGTNRTVSVTVTLAAIPRETVLNSIECNSSYLDGQITYKYTPQSAGFYTKRYVYLMYDDTYLTVRTTNLGRKSLTQQSETITFTTTELTKIYAKLPKTTSATIRITLRTYSDSNYTAQVGSRSDKEIVLRIPSGIKPSASLSIETVNNNEWIQSKGIYVAGYSGITVTLFATGTAGGGATISSYQISGGGFSVDSNRLSVKLLEKAGETTFTGTAKDSRGRSGSVSKSITVLPYVKPRITVFQVERGTYGSEWTAADDGPDVRVLFNTTLSLHDYGNVYSAGFAIDGAERVPDHGVTAGIASESNQIIYFLGVDGESSCALTLTVTDEVGNSSSARIIVPTIHITMEFNKSGKGVAVGKTSETDSFECGLDAIFYGKVHFSEDAAIKKAIRESLGIGKDIWKGECSAGESIVIEELQSYSLYRAYMSGLSSVITLHKSGSYLRGIGGLWNSDGYHRTYSMSARILNEDGEYDQNGTTVRLSGLTSIDHIPSGQHGAATAQILSRIVGIL